ncbi:MAG: 3-oxoacyl-ACP reductase family protein [Dehalococcoidales bacterium]|nr:3-oxoacyl-ACP reductase family protein [Dehalococcoidales bacterium]
MDLSMFALTDRVAIVTGSGRGIGRAIALCLAQLGADIVAVSRTVSEIEETAASIRATGRRALAIPTDVCQADQVGAMISRTVKEFGKIDVVVNNAGGYVDRLPASKLTVDAFEKTLQMNLTSTFVCSKHAGEVMIKQKAGSIVNISSAIGFMLPVPDAPHYAAAKAGVISLTRSLAAEYGQYGIRVNAVAPGLVMTERARKRAPENSPLRQTQLKRIALGRLGQPEDITGAVAFLASDASGYITGETILVNGGALPPYDPPTAPLRPAA